MHGSLSHEVEVNVPASQAWDAYKGLKIALLVGEQLNDALEKVEVLEGDGGPGTIIKLVFKPGIPGISSYKEKFTIVDDEKRLKQVEVIEGGYLELGFTYYGVRFEVIEKREDWCITRATIEYDLKEEAAANASVVTIRRVAKLLEFAAKYLLENKNKN
ncbi:norbelladine synthase-like [Diospyros lotus]|uniref:norbelladine synthase-like n=1 Tax=Diospyros lotus TaxID=55363 RepID=UPI00224E304D|nr:norbelladine synthase-like [Diospyros lotus]